MGEKSRGRRHIAIIFSHYLNWIKEEHFNNQHFLFTWLEEDYVWQDTTCETTFEIKSIQCEGCYKLKRKAYTYFKK